MTSINYHTALDGDVLCQEGRVAADKAYFVASVAKQMLSPSLESGHLPVHVCGTQLDEQQLMNLLTPLRAVTELY